MDRRKTISMPKKDLQLLLYKDGKVFCPGEDEALVFMGNLCGSFSQKEDIFLALSKGEEENSPGGKNFETAKKMLENYRFYSLAEKTQREMKEGFLVKQRDAFDSYENVSEKKTKPENSKPKLSEILLDAIDCSVENLMNSGSPSFEDAGELLYARYIKPEYENKDVVFYMALFRVSRATYFRMLNSAISYVAGFLFGIAN